MRERRARDRATAERAAAERVRRYTALRDELGERLARTPDGHPDGDHLVKLFHDVLAKLEVAEAAVAK